MFAPGGFVERAGTTALACLTQMACVPLSQQWKAIPCLRKLALRFEDDGMLDARVIANMANGCEEFATIIQEEAGGGLMDNVKTKEKSSSTAKRSNQAALSLVAGRGSLSCI